MVVYSLKLERRVSVSHLGTGGQPEYYAVTLIDTVLDTFVPLALSTVTFT